MRLFWFRFVLVFACCVTAGGSLAGQQLYPQHTEPLTNASVIKLVRAGFKEKTVIAIIRSRVNTFDLTADRLIELKHNGVTENVILAMLANSLRDFSTGDEWGDDAFFPDEQKSLPGQTPGSQKEEGTSIFGSGGSSRSQTRGRGLKGENEGETQTTGAATVRILRPPAEEGGAAIKLERTPTLTNDSVIQLVEAGFSEGTIIKRIEKSPVEFDLSPPKLSELRKRRVSQSIIAAMTAAMSDGPAARVPPEKPREN